MRRVGKSIISELNGYGGGVFSDSFLGRATGVAGSPIAGFTGPNILGQSSKTRVRKIQIWNLVLLGPPGGHIVLTKDDPFFLTSTRLYFIIFDAV
jgi:hypothetical protein